jgi:hypothetical protein
MARVEPILPVGRYEQFKKQQAAVMQQHQQYAAQLQEKQAQAQMRAGDLDVAGKVMKLLSPTIPKPARNFLGVQLAQHVGIDPKSEGFKGLNAMINSLDPDSMQRLNSAFSQQLEGAEPGQIVEMTKGLMTGQLPLDQFLSQVDFSGGGGEEQVAGGEGQDQLGTETAKPFQGGPGATKSLAGPRTNAPIMDQASPMLVGALGIDSKTRYRTDDLVRQGLRLPMDVKDQEKLAENITTRTVGLSATLSESANMLDLFSGKPEALGLVGSLSRGANTVVRQVEGFLNLVRPGTTVDDADETTMKLAREVGGQVARMHKFDQNAEAAARVEAMTLGLAYRMATANNIPGNRLTNGIIQQNLAQIGKSGSPEQFKAILKDTIGATTREYDEYVRRTVGVSGVDILAKGVQNNDLKRFSEHKDMLPTELQAALRQEAHNRVKGTGQSLIVPQSPTLDEEEKTLGGLEMQDKERQIAKTDQEMQLATDRDKRAESAERRAEGREDRMATAQEQSAKIQKEQLDLNRKDTDVDNTRADRAQDRADVREDRLTAATESGQALAREKFDYEKTKDTAEEDRRRGEAIQKAFLEFGKAIAGIGAGGGGSVGGGFSGAGGNQDTSAFQLTPTPQRHAPKPVGS